MKNDPKVNKIIKAEEKRQNETLMLIPSENYASKAVREASGSVFSNKYSEGYPKKRYYQGNEFADDIELLAIDRAKKLFNVPYVNVQPYSGSPANAEIMFALLNKGDKIMGLSLPFGGHLTHGHPKVTFSGKYFISIPYSTDKNGYLDYKQIEKLAKKHKPKLIISGTTAYPRKIDFKKFGEIAQKVGAYHMADISHIAGLVATGQHQSPVKYADVVMTTTHKTLRGPRGAMIMTTNKELADKIDKAVFPGMQGGPHNNTTSAIAVALKEADTVKFNKYSKQIVANAKALAKGLKQHSFKLLTGGTDNHLILIDVTNKGLDGWSAAWALEYAGIIVNRNTIPFDTKSAYYPSGIRLGTPAVTTRGMKEKEMKKIASWINEVIDITQTYVSEDIDNKNKKTRLFARRKFRREVEKDKDIKKIKDKVKKLCLKFILP